MYIEAIIKKSIQTASITNKKIYIKIIRLISVKVHTRKWFCRVVGFSQCWVFLEKFPKWEFFGSQQTVLFLNEATQQQSMRAKGRKERIKNQESKEWDVKLYKACRVKILFEKNYLLIKFQDNYAENLFFENVLRK